MGQEEGQLPLRSQHPCQEENTHASRTLEDEVLVRTFEVTELVRGRVGIQTKALWRPHPPVSSLLLGDGQSVLPDHDLGACLRMDLFILS